MKGDAQKSFHSLKGGGREMLYPVLREGGRKSKKLRTLDFPILYPLPFPLINDQSLTVMWVVLVLETNYKQDHGTTQAANYFFVSEVSNFHLHTWSLNINLI